LHHVPPAVPGRGAPHPEDREADLDIPEDHEAGETFSYWEAAESTEVYSLFTDYVGR
jgi:hypothetical protein